MWGVEGALQNPITTSVLAGRTVVLVVPKQHHSASPCFSSFRVLVVGREQCRENCGFATDFQDLICPNDYSA